MESKIVYNMETGDHHVISSPPSLLFLVKQSIHKYTKTPADLRLWLPQPLLQDINTGKTLTISFK